MGRNDDIFLIPEKHDFILFQVTVKTCEQVSLMLVHVIKIYKAHVQRSKCVHSDSCLNFQLGGLSTRTNQREVVCIKRNSSEFAMHIFVN